MNKKLISIRLSYQVLEKLADRVMRPRGVSQSLAVEIILREVLVSLCDDDLDALVSCSLGSGRGLPIWIDNLKIIGRNRYDIDTPDEP